MIISLKRTAVASLAAALTLSAAALATPVSAADNTWRGHRHSAHWRHSGWGCEGAGCYRYGYGPFYPGYGYNRNNFCYEGESMYDGC
jgi:hypothetical protein